MDKKLNKYRYTGKEEFVIADFDTDDTGNFDDRSEAVEEFVENLRKINEYQQKLYADSKEGIVFIFQAMDAAGKDGVIRTVFSTLSPHGVKEYCFKVPSKVELAHDYLWRFWDALPARGNISIFNRSYYEDVLVGKVKLLYKGYAFPERLKKRDMIADRYSQIKDFEKYLYNTGTRVVKIFLNVSKDEQARRFISRIDEEKKNWKLSLGDIEERQYWDEYMEAFETMVNKTSSKDSPWYVVPSDHKWYSRLLVSRIVLETLKEADPKWPTIAEEDMENISEVRASLMEGLEEYEKEEMPELFKKPERIAEAIYVSSEKDKMDAKTRKVKEQVMSNFRDFKELGGSFDDFEDLMEICFNEEGE